MIEYLDRLRSGLVEETWIARIDGRLGNVQIQIEEDVEWTQGMVRGSQPWVGLEHPHLIPLWSITHTGNRLVIATGDERGPNMLEMAHQLTDAREREQWALGELAGVAEAVAMMQWRDKSFVHRRVEPSNLVVGADGHVRLRAPVFTQSTRLPHGYLGNPRPSKFSSNWMTPEQVVGFPLSPASDVFQLAHLAYTAMTLKAPWMAETDFERLTKMKDAVAPRRPVENAPGVADLVMQNIAKEPEKRLKDPRAFARAVRDLVGETPPAILAKVAALRTDRKPAPHESAAITGYRCEKKWDELTETPDEGIRHCASCKHDVVEVRSIEALIPLLGKRCIAYKPE